MAILKNVNQLAVIHLVANATLVVAGNSSVSNLALTGETLSHATIKKVWWGTENANTFWTVKRGANTVAVFNATGNMDLTISCPITVDKTANLVFEKTGNSGFILMEVQKN